MNDINVILNGKNVTGSAGETILSLATRLGIEIPTLCNDPRLDPYSSCYVCLVEIAGMRGLQPACSTRINEGMTVTTDNDKISKARKSALDLLLSNHYADCVAPCKMTCPAGVDVQGYISLIEKGLYSEAVALIKKVNPLPAICGRVCVRPCEVACRRNLLDEGAAVGIDYLKRFAADQDLESPHRYIAKVAPSTGKKVAIIGAGPGGLSAAWFMQQDGHQCDIYEALPAPGGWLRYGIPEYRLPNEIIDREVAAITELGAKIFYNKKLGENVSYKELKSQYDAVILTIGSQRGTPIGCENDDAGNVFSGIDFLRNMEVTQQRYDFSGKTIAVIGGGNTAMDCCRTSLRCNASKVYVIYRRTEKEMPANPIEIHESKLEGVEYMLLTAPKQVNKDKDGNVESITCFRMELGEPDASGRRRPVVVEGSDFDVKVDYILAAIGQKTDVNFIDDVNAHSGDQQLKVNKWGDIDCDRQTLQTGIKSMFAAGDGVTGPATAIEAIAQARRASRSCHQYLMGLPLEAEGYEFISKRDNFKKQIGEDYKGHYHNHKRHEMPTIDPAARNNFKEVELGYENEKVAKEETGRCLECGCVEYYSCDLKKHASKYQANQEHYAGSFKQYNVKFEHPFVEIDNNKCILCARCVRICNEVVGATALGLVNRGFETYVAPSLGGKLQDTNCESCGLCISACPTAAISENVPFKPGPVETTPIETICNYCSVGCAITLHTKGKFITRTTGRNGQVNTDGNLCRYAKFGYQTMNTLPRLKKPMLKENGEFREITFEEAYSIIAKNIQTVKAEENAFFAGARLTSEEMFLIQRLARQAAKSENCGSFHYMGRPNQSGSTANMPFAEIRKTGKIYLLGSEINQDNAVAGFMVQNAHFISNIPVELITNHGESSLEHKVNKVTRVNGYYYFVKAANYFLLKNGKQNSMFISDRCSGFEAYREKLLADNYNDLVTKSGVEASVIEAFANDYNEQLNAVIIYSEKDLCFEAYSEVMNLAMITGKLGKTANGIICLKEKNNSEGLLNLGIADPGLAAKLASGGLKNLFIFGEDPIGCIKEGEVKGFGNAAFVMVQDYYMTETAKKANLVMPASFPYESGGSFTNTQRVIQMFDKSGSYSIKECNIGQLTGMLREFGINSVHSVDDAHTQMLAAVANQQAEDRYGFTYTVKCSNKGLFAHGCDSMTKRFDEYFEQQFSK